MAVHGDPPLPHLRQATPDTFPVECPDGAIAARLDVRDRSRRDALVRSKAKIGLRGALASTRTLAMR